MRSIQTFCVHLLFFVTCCCPVLLCYLVSRPPGWITLLLLPTDTSMQSNNINFTECRMQISNIHFTQSAKDKYILRPLQSYTADESAASCDSATLAVWTEISPLAKPRNSFCPPTWARQTDFVCKWLLICTEVLWSDNFSHIPSTLSLPSARQHPSYGYCLEVKTEYYQNCCVLDCVTQCSQSKGHLYEQFLQVKQIGFVTLGPLRCAYRGGCVKLYYSNMVEWFWWDASLIFDDQLVSFSALTLLVWSFGL